MMPSARSASHATGQLKTHSSRICGVLEEQLHASGRSLLEKGTLMNMKFGVQGSPEGTIQVQLTQLAQDALGQPELAATSDARLQAAFGQAGKEDLVQTGQTTFLS